MVIATFQIHTIKSSTTNTADRTKAKIGSDSIAMANHYILVHFVLENTSWDKTKIVMFTQNQRTTVRGQLEVLANTAYDGCRRVEVNSAKIFWNGNRDSRSQPIELLHLEPSDAWAQICGIAWRGAMDDVEVVFREADEAGY